MSNSSLSGTPLLSSGPESDIPESLSTAREGYDYIFVPKFGSGYECPICLLILREPRQTKCGHRFCRDCLSHWMNESSNRCPVDNEPLSEADIFPDNCIKREILSCSVQCPNHAAGCIELTTILQMQKHLDQCLLSLVPCPLSCCCVFPRRDIEDHLQNHCEYRIVTCQNCKEETPACKLEEHKSQCPKEVIKCSYCGLEICREKLNHHIECVCKNVVVPCPFHAVGCSEQILREMEEEHLSEEIPSHLKMLATSFNAVLEGFSSLATGLQHVNKQTGTAHSDKDSQISITEYGVSNSDRLGSSLNDSFQRQRSQNPRHSGTLIIEGDNSSAVYESGMGQRSSSSIETYNFVNEGNISNNSGNLHVGSHHLYSSMPQTSELLDGKNDSTGDTNNHNNSTAKLNLTSSQSVPILYQRSAHASETPSSDQGFGTDILQPNFAEFANSLRDLCVHQQQVMGKQQIIVSNLCAKLSSVEARLKQLEGDGVVGSVQSTCGDYYWSINDFSVHREKALREETSILHSPAFYSSPWGYKLCLRANVNGSLNNQNEHFLSLFIHFMQGNNDHLLNWPFVGQIVLSIIDQNPTCKERRHAMETLKARPDIAAFQKPTSARNHKGFGYTDFISLNVLDNGNFVRDDTLIIRAQVFPSPPP